MEPLVKKVAAAEILNIQPKSLSNLIERYEDAIKILGGEKIQGEWNFPRETLIAIKEYAGDKTIDIKLLRDYQASVNSDTAINDSVSDTAPVDSGTSLAVSNDNVISDNAALPQLTIEIKFYLNQTAQNIIEVGKRLIQAKELVPHGEWLNWLQNNFNLSIPTAQKFMQISDRFGISRIDTAFAEVLSPTQMIAMLALPAGDEEKFIAEMAAKGTPVEDMTTRKLREEIQKYKDESQGKDAKIKELEDKQTTLEGLLEDTHKDIAALSAANQKIQSTLDEKDELHKAELDSVRKENQKELKERDYRIHGLIAQVKSSAANEREQYEEIQKLKTENDSLNKCNEDLTKKLADAESKATIETVPPADYEDLKSKAEKAETLQSELNTAQKTIEEMKDNAEKTKAENDKTARATAIIDTLVNAFQYAHSEFYKVYPANVPAEVQDNFKAISDNINAISNFILRG